MNTIKKISLLLILSISLIGFTACGKKELTPEQDLETIMEDLYAGISDEDKPMLFNKEITEEEKSYFLGTEDIEFEEAFASDAAISSIPHSVVLLKVKEGTDVEKVKEQIKENADPRKWICVEAEKVIVKNKGNLIILIMSSEDMAEKIETNFSKL